MSIEPAQVGRRQAGTGAAADELTEACDRALELGLVTWVPEHGDTHAGPIASVDVIAGRTCARLAPTHLGWLDGNVLFELFWSLA